MRLVDITHSRRYNYMMIFCIFFALSTHAAPPTPQAEKMYSHIISSFKDRIRFHRIIAKFLGESDTTEGDKSSFFTDYYGIELAFDDSQASIYFKTIHANYASFYESLIRFLEPAEANHDYTLLTQFLQGRYEKLNSDEMEFQKDINLQTKINLTYGFVLFLTHISDQYNTVFERLIAPHERWLAEQKDTSYTQKRDARHEHMKDSQIDELDFVNNKIKKIEKFIDPWWALSEKFLQFKNKKDTCYFDASKVTCLFQERYTQISGLIGRFLTKKSKNPEKKILNDLLSKVLLKYENLYNYLKQANQLRIEASKRRPRTPDAVLFPYADGLELLQLDIVPKLKELEDDYKASKKIIEDFRESEKTTKTEALENPAASSDEDADAVPSSDEDDTPATTLPESTDDETAVTSPSEHLHLGSQRAKQIQKIFDNQTSISFEEITSLIHGLGGMVKITRGSHGFIRFNGTNPSGEKAQTPICHHHGRDNIRTPKYMIRLIQGVLRAAGFAPDES